MHRSARTILLLLSVCLLSSPSHAGQTSNQPNVYVGLFGSSSYFYGAIGVARSSADGLQYIGCGIYGTTSGKTVYCSARDAAGNVGSCSSMSQTMLDAVSTMTENSILDVGFGQYDGVCSHISVIDESTYLPISP
jgi:hypothetical protein